MNIGEKIKQARKVKGISQETLAAKMGLSVQAVSKWECDLSCPDIGLLPQIADFLEVSLDYLLREEQNNMPSNKSLLTDLPDDDVLRIVQCVGQRLLSFEDWKDLSVKQKIPLCFDETWKNRENLSINVEIWGTASIEGAISGDVSAGGGVNCDRVGNNVNAGGSINCDCIGNDAAAGGSINCDQIGNNASAGGVINCGDVGNNASAGTSITCGDIQGNVQCNGEIHCCTIRGDVTGGKIFMDI